MTEEEFRRDAIERYLKGEHPKSIYEGMGRSKAWFFKWLKRYRTGASHWYKSLPKAPRQTPRKVNLLPLYGRRFTHLYRKIQVPENLFYCYVKAVIDTSSHSLELYLGE